MVRRNYLGLVGGAFAALAMSCGGPMGGDAGDAGGEAAADVQTEARTYTYVIDRLSIDMTDDAMVPHTGFDLDNRWSLGDQPADCSHEDFFSMIDQDQNCRLPASSMDRSCPPAQRGCARGSMDCAGGVDNQLPTLANTIETIAGNDIRATIQNQISSNSLSLIVRITGVNSLENDDSVNLQIFTAYPTFSTDCSSVRPGREYVVSSDSVMMGATSIDQARFQFQGSIVNGRLRVVNSGEFRLPLPELMGVRLELPLNNTQVRVTLNADGMTGTNGNLGGAVRGNDIVNAVAMIRPDFRDQVETALSGLVDIETMGICFDRMSMPRRFGSIGLGLGLNMVNATIRMANPIATSRIAGACGTGSSGDAGPRDSGPADGGTGG